MVRTDARTSQADAQGAPPRFAVVSLETSRIDRGTDRKEQGIGFARRPVACQGQRQRFQTRIIARKCVRHEAGLTDAAGLRAGILFLTLNLFGENLIEVD